MIGHSLWSRIMGFKKIARKMVHGQIISERKMPYGTVQFMQRMNCNLIIQIKRRILYDVWFDGQTT